MAHGISEQFTFDHVLHDDESMSFSIPTSSEDWPWLVLDPKNPIVVQALTYYALYETDVARGLFNDGQWTALTGISWRCAGDATGHASHGVARLRGAALGGQIMEFWDENDALVYEMTGEGVVFRDRNFQEWRNSQKQGLGPEVSLKEFSFASHNEVGVGSPIESIVSSLDAADPTCVDALVTAQNGFPPGHPYHDGSGDHVNSSHLADAATQFARLLRRNPGLESLGGEMKFRRYVELGQVFTLQLVSNTAEVSEMRVLQGGQECASINFTWARGSTPA
ncbi:MAG: hypothetical protein AAGG55_08700 [Pseudomonadota bacterium]